MRPMCMGRIRNRVRGYFVATAALRKFDLWNSIWRYRQMFIVNKARKYSAIVAISLVAMLAGLTNSAYAQPNYQQQIDALLSEGNAPVNVLLEGLELGLNLPDVLYFMVNSEPNRVVEFYDAALELLPTAGEDACGPPSIFDYRYPMQIQNLIAMKRLERPTPQNGGSPTDSGLDEFVAMYKAQNQIVLVATLEEILALQSGGETEIPVLLVENQPGTLVPTDCANQLRAAAIAPTGDPSPFPPGPPFTPPGPPPVIPPGMGPVSPS